MPDYTVYILQNPEGKFYIGQTRNLNERLKRHAEDRSTYTKGKGPWKLIHQEAYTTRADALKREKQLKKWRRELIQRLIQKE
ncbi:GIY-YIG nuclease family protein [Candidatus Neomarinimicrobiota bacterium]